MLVMVFGDAWERGPISLRGTVNAGHVLQSLLC